MIKEQLLGNIGHSRTQFEVDDRPRFDKKEGKPDSDSVSEEQEPRSREYLWCSQRCISSSFGICLQITMVICLHYDI